MTTTDSKKAMPFEGLHEEWGIFGMYDFDGGDVASSIYYGLFALQHRGQESCGIAVSETSGPKGKVTSYKGMGLVNEVFDGETLEKMRGDIGVGHVRYSTAGESTRENAQPLVLNYVKGTLALAHNGNLINAKELKKDLEYTGAIFQTTIDSEVIAYHIARERLQSKTAEEAVRRACMKLKGAYALVVASPRKLIGARDPFGFKPLCIGKRDNAYILASETCALDTIGAEFVRDVLPGEVVTITRKRALSPIWKWHSQKKKKPDVFLNIFILQDRTVILTGSAFMAAVSRRASSLPWTHRLKQTWLPAYRSRAMRQLWAIPYSPGSLTELLLSKTVMWDVPLSNQSRAVVNPVCVSS